MVAIVLHDSHSFDLALNISSTLGMRSDVFTAFLFVEFFELFKRGEGIRILDRMNAMKLHPMGDFAES